MVNRDDTHRILPRLLEGPVRIRHQERVLAQAILETGKALPVSKLPGSPEALRGLPAIGRNVHGHIRGTRPDTRYD